MVTAGIVLVSAAVQSMTGFGFAGLAVPLLAMIWAPMDAVSISMTLSTLSAVLMWPGLRKAPRLPILKPLAVAALVGLPLGLLALQRLDLNALRLIIGIVTLATVAVFAAGILRPAPQAVVATPRLALSAITGFVAGALTGALSMPGPPLVMLLTATRTPKTAYRATLTAFALFIYPVALAALVIEGLITRQIITQSLLQAPVLVLGIWIGRRLHGAVSERGCALSSRVLLALAGVRCFAGR